MPKKQRRIAARFRVFSPDLGVNIEESAPNKEQAIAMADSLAEQNPSTTIGVWTPGEEHIYQVSLNKGKWTVYVNPEDASPEELIGQEHLMMVKVHQPRSQVMTYTSVKVPCIAVNGAIYKQALQPPQHSIALQRSLALRMLGDELHTTSAYLGKNADRFVEEHPEVLNNIKDLETFIEEAIYAIKSELLVE